MGVEVTLIQRLGWALVFSKLKRHDQCQAPQIAKRSLITLVNPKAQVHTHTIFNCIIFPLYSVFNSSTTK